MHPLLAEQFAPAHSPSCTTRPAHRRLIRSTRPLPPWTTPDVVAARPEVTVVDLPRATPPASRPSR